MKLRYFFLIVILSLSLALSACKKEPCANACGLTAPVTNPVEIGVRDFLDGDGPHALP